MVKKTDKSLFQCEICLLHFELEELAIKYEDRCKNDNNCNFPITKQSIEAKNGKSCSD